VPGSDLNSQYAMSSLLSGASGYTAAIRESQIGL